MCCGPCSVYPASVLQEEGIMFEGLFFNPNIHPYDEFIKRKENLKLFTDAKNITLSCIDEFSQDIWEKFNSTNNDRCRMCYEVRMNKAASYAKANGFDAFTTTLLVSPYQNHELIKEIGEKYAKDYGIEFYYRDFRPGFRQGQQQAKEMGLYRQKYCGCIISYNTSQVIKKSNN